MKFLKPTLIGGIAHTLSQLLLKTYRTQVVIHPSVQPKQQYLYGFWHDKQFTPILLMNRLGNRRYVGLVSPSRDGEYLAHWLKRLGYEVVRGSSSRQGVKGLVKLLRALKEGYSLGITADGPRGPAYEAKAGIAFLSYKANIAIIPIGVAHSAKWQFNKAWDKYQLPLPFSKILLYLGEPIQVSDLQDTQAISTQISQAITQADQEASRFLIPA